MKQPIYDTIRNGIIASDVLTCELDGLIKTGDLASSVDQLECKYCKSCQTVLPVAFFHKHKVVNNCTTYQTFCKECQKTRNADNKAKRLNNQEYREEYYTKQRHKQRQRREIIKNNALLDQHFREKQKIYFRDRRSRNKAA